MAGSDITATTAEDSQAASTTFIAAAARPNLVFTLAKTEFPSSNSFSARKLTVTTTGTADNGKTVTIVGTDLNDKSITEVIVSTGSAETISGVRYFKTIVSATCSAQYAANVSLGMTNLVMVLLQPTMRRLQFLVQKPVALIMRQTMYFFQKKGFCLNSI